jgi:hypothetical protein
MWCDSLKSLRHEGFIGFQTVADLRASGLKDVPKECGVYLILRNTDDPPNFLSISTAGRFKGKDPTVSTVILTDKWVPSVQLIYIGKAGGEGSSSTLRSRLKAYLDFGAGKPVGHWGGRYIWQLRDAGTLLVCWKPTPDEDPLVVEQRLIDSFTDCYGKMPFANCRR